MRVTCNVADFWVCTRCQRGFGFGFVLAPKSTTAQQDCTISSVRLPKRPSSGDTPKSNNSLIRLMDERISTRFWFEHSSGTRLHPYKLRDKRTGRLAFRVVEPRAGANRVAIQLQLDNVEDLYRHVMQMGWYVRMRSIDGHTEGLYNRDSYSIVSNSEFTEAMTTR